MSSHLIDLVLSLAGRTGGYMSFINSITGGTRRTGFIYKARRRMEMETRIGNI